MPAVAPSRSPSRRSLSSASGAQRVAGGVRAVVRRSEHAQGGVALELVDPAALLLDDLDDEREEAVEQHHHLMRRAAQRQAGRADHVHEDDRHLAQLAAQLDLPLALERRLGHLAAHVAAEQIAQALALAQARCHRVEAGLEQADLAAVVDGHLGVEVTLLHAGDRSPHGGDRLGDRARGDRDRERADSQADPGEEGNRRGEQRRVLVRVEDPRGGDREDAEQRDAGAERPCHRKPAGNAGADALRRRRARQGERRDRPDDPLDEQVADRAGGLAAEQHHTADHECRPAHRRHVQRREQHGADHPEDPRDEDEVERLAEHHSALRLGRRPVRLQPSLDRRRATTRPHRAECERQREVDRRDDPVQRQVAIRAGGCEGHQEAEQQEHHDPAQAVGRHGGPRQPAEGPPPQLGAVSPAQLGSLDHDRSRAVSPDRAG